MEATLLTTVPTPESTDKILEFPNDDTYTFDMKSSSNLHSCSSYKFFKGLASNMDTYNDILKLISKYYTPKQSSRSNIKKNIMNTIESSKVECNQIPIPSWNLQPDNEMKSYPSFCPYFSQHLTLELLFWVLLVLFFELGSNFGSFIVLFIFYSLIQCLIWCMAYFHSDGFYRYKHICCVPLYDKTQRIDYFNKIFDKVPTITASLGLHEGTDMADMGWDNITNELVIHECCTFIKPNIENENENECAYQNWFYCIGYETDIDFIDEENTTKFEDLCVAFINESTDENISYHSFDIKITHDLIEAYNKKYWSGYIMIVNCKSDLSVSILRFIIKLLNLLCLSLLYKIPIYFIKVKRLKIIKYIGFGA